MRGALVIARSRILFIVIRAFIFRIVIPAIRLVSKVLLAVVVPKEIPLKFGPTRRKTMQLSEFLYVV
jgi:hypothetical protein